MNKAIRTLNFFLVLTILCTRVGAQGGPFDCRRYLTECGVDVQRARRLQQREEQAVTTGNVDRLANRVSQAEARTRFVFEEDVQLTELVTVTANRLTFRGSEDARPTITCAEGERGFIIE